MTQRIQNGTPWEKAGQNVGNDDPVRLFSVDPQAQNRESSLFKIDRSSTVSPRRHLVESKQKQMQKQTQKKGGVRCGSDRHRVQCPALHHPRRPRGADRVFSEGMPPCGASGAPTPKAGRCSRRWGSIGPSASGAGPAVPAMTAARRARSSDSPQAGWQASTGQSAATVWSARRNAPPMPSSSGADR